MVESRNDYYRDVLSVEMEENMKHVDEENKMMMMNIINVAVDGDDDPFDIYLLNEMNTVTRYVALFKERKQIIR